jgi:hypothetical protein
MASMLYPNRKGKKKNSRTAGTEEKISSFRFRSLRFILSVKSKFRTIISFGHLVEKSELLDHFRSTFLGLDYSPAVLISPHDLDSLP